MFPIAACKVTKILAFFTFNLNYNVMHSINTYNLFMHGHEKWGASNIACPH